MPYYLINKEPVFLSSARYKKLEALISGAKDSHWRNYASKISGSKEYEEKQKLMFDALSKRYSDSPDSFRSEWINFDIKGKEASQNVWDLLYDYCHFYGYSFLSDLRDFSEKLVADYKGELYSYPMGEVFILNHFVKPEKWWWKFTNKMKGRKLQVIIDTEKVNHLRGNLKEFVVYIGNCKLICGENFQIQPK